MDRLINVGDVITAYWVIDGTQLTGIVKHVPQDTGDLWYVEDKAGNIHAINSNCSDFERIVKEATDDTP